MKKKPASAPGKAKKSTKTAVPAVSEDIDGEIARQAEDRAELAAKILNAPFSRPANDPFPASFFPSEEAMFQSLGVRPDLTGGSLKTQPATISEASAPFPMEAHSSGQTNSEDAGDGQGTREASATPLSAADDPEKNTGDVAFLEPSADSNSVDKSDIILPSSRVSRLPGEGRSGCHERLRRLARASGMPRGQGPGTAYNWALEQTNILFAKLAEPIPEPEVPLVALEPESIEPVPVDPEPVAVAPSPPADDQGVSGLSELPPGWPELPANAQLQVEIAWVTANRLRVRDGTGVNLSRALSPAPSYSALSWLETSILFPAKFADISVKATATQDDEREFIKREKLAIEEIRSILAEMMESEAG